MPDLPMTRRSLLIRLKDQSDDAWQEFLSIYERSLLDFAMRKGLQEADALDVTQEVLAALEKKLPDWELSKDRGKLRGWLFKVARNLAVNKINQRAKSPLAFGALNLDGNDDFVAIENQDSQLFLNQYRRNLLHWAADRIKQRVNETTWQAFWLTAMEGRGAEEVAKQLGQTVGNVYAAKFRVTARMQKLVDSINGLDESEWPQKKDQLRSEDQPGEKEQS